MGHALSIGPIDTSGLTIPLHTQGTKIQFESKAPSTSDLKFAPRICLTSKQDWKPHSVNFDTTVNQLYTTTKNQTPIDNDILGRLTTNTTKIISEVTRYDDTLEDLPTRQSYTSSERHAKVSAEVLADRFAIGIEKAHLTLQGTHQKATRSALLPLSRRYRADRHYENKILTGKFSTDTLWFPSKSLTGNVACQVYSDKSGFNAIYHLTRANDENIGNSLRSFISEYGIPEHLTCDGAAVQTGRHTIFQKTIRKHQIKSHVSAAYRPNENPVEGSIREIKTRWYRLKAKKKVPDRLTDFGIKYIAETGNVIVNSSKYSNGRTPIEIITGDTPDISEFIDFGFYDWCHYRTNAGLGEPELGRWLGISHRVGKLMSYWILPKSGIPISATTVQRVTNLEKQTDAFKSTMNDFQKQLERKWDVASATFTAPDDSNLLSLDDEDKSFLDEFNRVIDSKDIPNAEDLSARDPYINMELGFNREEDGYRYAKVKRRAIDKDGKPIGVANSNPLLDSRQYDVEYIDGKLETMTANIIAENLFAQVDDDGNRFLLIDEIEDHRKTKNAIPITEGMITTKSGLPRKRRTTQGWQFLVKWKGGTTDWVELKDLKDSYPIPLADYAISNNLQKEPAFAWWIPHAIRKRKTIISKVKSKYWQRTHKYGLRIPKSTKEAYEIDKENGDTMWHDAITMEMKNNRVAFQTFTGDVKDLVGYEEITGHIIFDIKLSENFRRKARFVADGHKVETPPSISYSTVVSRDSVRILLLIAALNGLDIMGCDVQNAFLSANNLEKHYL